MKRFLLLFWLILIVCKSESQVISPGYISIKNAYEFDLPQLDVSLSLPANTGFVVPVFSGKDVMLEIDDQTVYCFDLAYLDNPETNYFRFSLTGDDSGYIQLNINRTEKFDKVIEQERVRHRADFVEVLKTMKSGLGESVSYKKHSGGSDYDIHLFYNEGYQFIFSIRSDIKDKSSYMKIINGFRKKNLYKERMKYENRIKYGYFDKESKKPVIDINENSPKFRKIAGKTDTNKVIELPNQYMSVEIPSNWVYEFEGRNLVSQSDIILVLETSELDMFNNSMIFTWLRGEGMVMICRYSSKKSRNPANFSNISDGAKQVYSFSGDTKIFIDGIEVPCSYYGSPDNLSIDTWFETENGYYSFSAFNITIDNLPDYDRLFNNIKINSEIQRSKKAIQDKARLLSVIPVKKKKAIELDKLVFTGKGDIEVFKCKLSTVGATLWLPGKLSAYKYGLNRTFGKNILELDSESSVNLAPNYDNMFVNIYNGGEKYQVSCTLYLRYGDKATIEDVVKDQVRSRPDITTWSKVNKAGVIKAKDGSEWGVIIQDDGKTAWIHGQNSEYTVFLTVTGDNTEAIQDFCPLIYNFAFGNPVNK